MRSTYLTLAAIILLILCAILIIRQSGISDRNSTLAGHQGNPSQAQGGKVPVGTAAHSLSRIRTADESPKSISPSSPAKSSPGIQLSDEVRLPAVILALNAAENDPGSKVPPPIAAAMRGIVTTFYQDLADSVRETNADGSHTAPSDEDTILIKPGPAVERARERANETYRALFGEEAYNQMTLHAALEAQLPTDGK